jgi:hypothetical protein
MAALIVFLIGLASGLGAASNRDAHAPEAQARDAQATVSTCHAKPESVWIANLEDPAAPRWIAQGAGALCNPLSGERVEIDFLDTETH